MKQLLGLSSGLCMMRAFLCEENETWLNHMILYGWTFFGHVILRRHNCLVSMLEVLLFLCQYELLSWIFRIWIFIPQLKRIMPSSTPHQKFCFYHLPTRGRAEIKLGDAWYVSNVSIIFDCSMLYYLLFWTLLGFIVHFYIIF